MLYASIKGVCSRHEMVTQRLRSVREYKGRSSAQSRRTHGAATGLVGKIPRCPETLEKNREMNTTEKFYLPVDGILDMFNSFTGLHHQSRITHPVLQSAALTPATQHPKVSNISKTGMGIIKTVKGHWRQQDHRVVTSRSSSSGNRQVSTDRVSKRSVDLLELGLTKPRNCHRVVVLGAPKVGKTNILQRFLGKEFVEDYEPTTEDFHRKLFHIGGEAYQVDLLDAAGERNFPAKRRLSILTGDIFLLVFSLDDRESFSEVCELLDEIKAAKAKLLKLKHPARVPAVICGNKSDLEAPGAVRRSEVTETLGEDVSFFETSAKDGAGLDAMFRALATLGGLPDETSPSRHQVIPLLTYQSLYLEQRGRRGDRRRGLSAPCAATDPLARRPSFTSDLRLVLRTSTKPKPERCQIQ
ncbi:dexamethasone-induced Ras-related protein 1-like [Xyrichtys novacula]|uniref:Dexamethasone-induced Ras-related protein 1-like n=1 Tax=Xyrichtys novacula TaxID=13765 RepID=A0AAV1GQV4_XYRNO|nr:dexamethasone-induced Ras-related protein 1-like [Xyrichtys novacula]